MSQSFDRKRFLIGECRHDLDASFVERLCVEFVGRPPESTLHTIVKQSPYASYKSLTSDFLPPHNDGLYYKKIPELLVIRCNQPADFGGELFLYDGRYAADKLSETIKSNRTVSMTYSAGPYVASHPLFVRHQLLNQRVALYMDAADLTKGRTFSMDLTDHEISMAAVSIQSLTPSETIILNRGEFVVIDNFAYLHGRSGYQGPRSMERVLIF